MPGCGAPSIRTTFRRRSGRPRLGPLSQPRWSRAARRRSADAARRWLAAAAASERISPTVIRNLSKSGPDQFVRSAWSDSLKREADVREAVAVLRVLNIVIWMRQHGKTSCTPTTTSPRSSRLPRRRRAWMRPRQAPDGRVSESASLSSVPSGSRAAGDSSSGSQPRLPSPSTDNRAWRTPIPCTVSRGGVVRRQEYFERESGDQPDRAGCGLLPATLQVLRE